ncbi:MAG: MFS transporter, partial [Propionibacteriales bacterium]|nr:MFS transporter [Propionibacteriales bacterium]
MSPLGLHGSASRYVGSRFVTAIGGSVAAAVGPLLAALMFAAGPTQMALITGTSMIISIMLRVPVAGVIDRAPDERRIMVLFGLASAVVSAAVPLLWLADVLTFWRFLACMGLSALCTVVLSAAGYRMVNAVTEPGQRTRALGLLHSSQSAGDVIGQSTGGVLVGLAAPPLALLVDTLASVAG